MSEIKRILWKILIALAGTDGEAINSSASIDQVKQANIGALLLIPTSMGFISMLYLTSIFFETPFVPIALVWALSVFFIDRYLVISMEKSFKKSIGLWILRACLAGLMGAFIAHPLAMSFFDESVEEKLYEWEVDKREEITQRYDSLIEENRKDLDRIDEDLNFLKDQYYSYLTLNGNRYDDEKVSNVYNEYLLQRREKNTIRKKVNEDIEELEKEKSQYLNEIKTPNDYWKRYEAFEEIASEKPRAKFFENIILLLFLVLDTIPLISKLFSKKNTYDLTIENRFDRYKSVLDSASKEFNESAQSNVKEKFTHVQEEVKKNKKISADEAMQSLISVFNSIYKIASSSSMSNETTGVPPSQGDDTSEFSGRTKKIIIAGFVIAETAIIQYLIGWDPAYFGFSALCYTLLHAIFVDS